MIWGKKKLELRRQLFHLIMGVVFGLLIYFRIVTWEALAILWVALVLIASIHRKIQIKELNWVLLQLERPKALPGVGAMQMTFGMALTTFMFDDPKIAGAAIIILGVGDSVSTFIGKKYGEIKLLHNKRKSLEGSLSGFLAALIATAPLVGIQLAFLGSFVGMFFESFNERVGLDDNIIMPIAAGIAMWLAVA